MTAPVFGSRCCFTSGTTKTGLAIAGKYGVDRFSVLPSIRTSAVGCSAPWTDS